MPTTQVPTRTLVRNRGLRATPARLAILDILRASPDPLSAAAILERLHRRFLRVNKTTVYREIACLAGCALIQALDFGEGKKRYELVQERHHHAICRTCASIAHIELPAHLDAEEALINERHGFAVTSHTLEFFGTCASCQAA